jgi:N-acyl homoserine lactone hydrolase
MSGLATMPRIDVLELSRVTAVPSFHPNHVGFEPFPVYAFVIHHPDGLVLVDTGIGLDNSFINELYTHESVNLIDALHAHQIDERDITLIVNSHLHFDHCGQNHALAAPICAQAAEVEAARAEFYTVSDWAHISTERNRVVTGDADLAPGLRALFTPGHTPGHQSVVITAGGHTCVIAAQCILRSSAWRGVVEPDNLHGHEWQMQAADSLARLRALRPTTVYLSHDSSLGF